MQTRLMSFVEAVVSTAVGFVISIIATTFFLHLIHVQMTGGQLWWYTWFMTGISILRGFGLRRLFNGEFWKRWKGTYCQHCGLPEHKCARYNPAIKGIACCPDCNHTSPRAKIHEAGRCTCEYCQYTRGKA